jgi:Cu2+-exporting ATPase
VSTASSFSLSKIISGDFFLDILTSPAEGKQLTAEPPYRVTDIQSLNKKNVRLAYNLNIIRARDLFTLVEGRYKGLAQPHSDPQLENSRYRL